MSARTAPRRSPISRTAAALVLLACLCCATHAQRVQPQPVTDSSAQASPLTPVTKAPVADSSSQASPISPLRTGGPYIAPRTAVPISLDDAIDSGKIKQGQSLKARLTGPVAVHGGGTLPSGTPVTVTVIAAVPAGRIMAQGEFSLQTVRVGSLPVYTDTQIFDGKPGYQDLPDSAPALGTDAGLPAGAPLTFHVQPPPTAADAAPENQTNTPGSVNGEASGGPPPASAQKSTFTQGGGPGTSAGSGNGPAPQQKSVSPGDTTTGQQTQRSGQTSVAPNQPQSPAQTSPNPTVPR